MANTDFDIQYVANLARIALPPKLSAQLAEGIPNSALVHVEAAGHLANQEKPTDFNAEVSKFIRSID